MKILLAASEAAPFVKTGGLADVAGSLPKSLRKLGHDVRVVIPCYRAVREALRRYPDLPVTYYRTEIRVPIFGTEQEGQIDETVLPGSDIPVYLVVRDRYLAREHLYDPPGGRYPDNVARFSFFCRGVIDMVERLAWIPEVIHCHDWQTGLIPLCLRFEDWHPPIASVFTIHSLAYTGCFPMEDLGYTGVIWGSDAFQTLEFWHQISLLKAGIMNADILTTVSPRYAYEIQTPAYGHGFEGVIQHQADHLMGILNGIDTEQWNPRTDPQLVAPFGKDDLSGKVACRRHLQEALDLPPQEERPLFGMVTRLVHQKGIDLLEPLLDRLASTGSQLVILGAGDPHFEWVLSQAAERLPNCLRVRLGYDSALAQRIYAGADFFLMPSSVEPCGLAQMISMAYATPPIVHHVGGLADTVREHEPQNGFVFHTYQVESFWAAIERALAVYQDKERLHQIRLNAMACDFSWDASAPRYIEAYQRALARRHGVG